VIKVSGLRKSFRGQAVLRGVDLEVPDGSITIIIGRSDSGRIEVDGVDVTGLRGRALDEIRKRYGVVFQGGALFDSMTCQENVAFPLREKLRLTTAEIARRTDAALDQVGLAGVGDKYPEEVSGGMRKRVAIARALATEPEIVFFDEPTTGLDPVLVNTIHHLILDLHRRLRFTALMVSHEIPEIFEIADRVGMLHDGRILEVGPPATIQASQNEIVRQFIRGEPDTRA
jgi:phospholipid/cholesterol/gamma-HCH transport system ATP-binding protein